MNFLSDAELYAPVLTLEDWRARCLLAQALISHRLDTTSPDVAAVLAVLSGELSLEDLA